MQSSNRVMSTNGWWGARRSSALSSAPERPVDESQRGLVPETDLRYGTDWYSRFLRKIRELRSTAEAPISYARDLRLAAGAREPLSQMLHDMLIANQDICLSTVGAGT